MCFEIDYSVYEIEERVRGAQCVAAFIWYLPTQLAAGYTEVAQ